MSYFLWTLFALIIAFFLVVGIELLYHGIHLKCRVLNKIHGFKIVFLPFVGQYKQTYPNLMKIHNQLIKEGIVKKNDKNHTCVGIFLDGEDVIKNSPEKCRSICGCNLNEEEWKRFQESKNLDHLKSMIIPKGMGITTEFPLKKHLAIISIFIGMFKAYSAIGKWLEKKKKDTKTYVCAELYSTKKTEFVFLGEDQFGDSIAKIKKFFEK